jgi:glutamate synthase (NADPH/NADH) small chain
MEKSILDRRLNQMKQEGTQFRAGVNVGKDLIAADLKTRYDAVVLAVGATQSRELNIPGRDAHGVYQAMEYLPWGNKQALGELKEEPKISAKGKRVIILGGGDTGADCLGTAIRQGAAQITQIEILPRPSDERPSSQPWPTYPAVYRVSSAHEEAGDRLYSIATQEFVKDRDGKLTGLKIVETKYENGKFEPVSGTERVIDADMVLLALGFTGPEQNQLVKDLELSLDERGNIKRDDKYATNVEKIFVTGDAGRGQSLIVWAIAEGRSTAASVDEFLMGRTQLPSPVEPTSRPLTA